ncbi:hypothetical protein ACFFX0_25320 [Citricoccus parietis]|uniref:Uncharacterized protein n=1 Tax=Citricoccus parietis TaxID=592307 RepID=A0ABV5G5U8_9MICC
MPWQSTMAFRRSRRPSNTSRASPMPQAAAGEPTSAPPWPP